MADIFDKMISGVSKGLSTASEQSKLLIEKAKINTAISDLEKEKKQLAELLGVKVYNMFMEDNFTKEEVESFCNEITKRNGLIEEQQRNLQALEMSRGQASMAGVQGTGSICGCGTLNPPGAKFCSKCGSSLQ